MHAYKNLKTEVELLHTVQKSVWMKKEILKRIVVDIMHDA